MWRFIEIRKLAIDRLTAIIMDPIDTVVLAKEYKVPQWLQTGYKELAVRETMMTDDEARKIGYPTTIQVWHIREEYRGRVIYGHGFDMNNLVSVFTEELKEVRAAYADYS
jgi:hypothetical protein